MFNTESSRALLELKHNSPFVLPRTLSPFICVFSPGGIECSPQGGPPGKEGEYVNYTKGLTLGPTAQRLISSGHGTLTYCTLALENTVRTKCPSHLLLPFPPEAGCGESLPSNRNIHKTLTGENLPKESRVSITQRCRTQKSLNQQVSPCSSAITVKWPRIHVMVLLHACLLFIKAKCRNTLFHVLLDLHF